MEDEKRKRPSLEELEQFLNIAPFHRWLNLKISAITEKGLEIEMPWRSEIISIPNPQQVVHGGILAALIDLTGLYAVMSQGGLPVGTAYMNVDYHRQATEGPLTAKANVLKIGRILSSAEIHVHGPDDQLLASGRGGYQSLLKGL